MTLADFRAPDIEAYADLRSVPKHRRLAESSTIKKLALAVPFDFISICGLDIDNFRLGQETLIESNLPPTFVELYNAEKLEGVDPLVKAACGSEGPVRESAVLIRNKMPDRIAYLLELFGIYNRILFPVRRADITYGAVTIARSTPLTADETAFMELIAEPVHTAISKPLMDRFRVEETKLTPGELACLAQASIGLTSEEIARETGYQPDTVNSYIKTAAKKLGVGNRSHAIAEAIRRKLIA